MYDLMIYSLKVGVCLAVFYLFFKLLLSRETFHRLNRIVVLAAMVGCSVLAVKFSSICCILFCGAAGVLTYAVGQGKKGGTK